MEIERLIEQLRRFGGELGATPLNNVIGRNVRYQRYVFLT